MSKSIGLALFLEGNLLFFFVLPRIWGQFPSSIPRGGLIFGGAFQRRVFCVTILSGLYLEGLIHGGANFRKFTVLIVTPFADWVKSKRLPFWINLDLIKGIRILDVKSGKILHVESGIQLKESRIPLMIGIQNPNSTDKDWNPVANNNNANIYTG